MPVTRVQRFIGAPKAPKKLINVKEIPENVMSLSNVRLSRKINNRLMKELISGPGRATCRYCRYQKCIKVGMARRKFVKRNLNNETDNLEIPNFGNFDDVFDCVLKLFRVCK